MSPSVRERFTQPRRTKRPVPPGPRSLNPFHNALEFRRNPLNFLAGLVKQYGDISQFHLFNMPIIFINTPEYLKHILQEKYSNYDKNVFLFEIVRPLLGNGSLNAIGGQTWLHQRRMLQPAFHRQRIAVFGMMMTQATTVMLQRWEKRADGHAPLDLLEEMGLLTLQIVCKALLSIDDFSEHAQTLMSSTLEINRELARFAHVPFPPLTFPTPSHRHFWQDIHKLDKIVYTIIDQRRQSKEDTGDVLSMLMQAIDEETGKGMSSVQLRDEIITFLLAGHETSANALAWIWYLLAQHPEVEQRLHTELEQVLAGRIPTAEDIPQLAYTHMIIEEALRLYPTAWQLMRRACQDDEIGGYFIPANSTLFWSSYILHRHPDFWEKPEEFYPEHFLPEKILQRPHNTYIPFGAGPRMCIGKSFAIMEILLILAMIAQRYQLRLIPGLTVTPEPLITLRPSNLQVQALPR